MKARQLLPACGVLVAVLGSAAFLAACGSSSSDSGGTGEEGATGTKPTITMISFAGSDYYAGYVRGAEAEADELGLELEVQDAPSYEASDIAATINAAVATSPDYLLVPAVDAVALRQPLLAASERGVNVITYDSQLEDPDFIVTYVNSDYTEYGRKSAEELGRVAGAKGKALLVSLFTGNDDLERLATGFHEGLPASMTELPVQYDQAENGKAAAIVRATLTREPELAGLAAPSGFGAEGAIAALREAGKVGDVKVVLYAASDDEFSINAVRKGEAQAVIGIELAEVAKAAVDAAVEDAEGKDLPPRLSVPFCVITEETVNKPADERCVRVS